MLHRSVIAHLIGSIATLIIVGCPDGAHARCATVAELFDTQRRARGMLMAANAHRATHRALTAERSLLGEESHGTLILEGASWSSVPLCVEGATKPVDMMPMEISYRRDEAVKVDETHIGLSAFGLVITNEIDGANGDDGLRLHLGAEARFETWLSVGAALVFEQGVLESGSTETYFVLDVGVPTLRSSLTAVIGGLATLPETVLLDIDVPVVDWLSAPARLTWRENEALMSLRTGLDARGRGGVWLAFENSEEVFRSAGGYASLMLSAGGMVKNMTPAEREAYLKANGGRTPDIAFGIEGALTYSGGRTVRALGGGPLIGGAADLVMRFNVQDATGSIRFGWARNEATVLDELPHVAGFNAYRMRISVQY